MDVTLDQAAHVLGAPCWRAEQILGTCPYVLDTVEQAALVHYNLRGHRQDQGSYWVDTVQAAAILEVSTRRVRQLCERGRIPYLVHADGRRHFMLRRSQIEVIAHARKLRRLGQHLASD